MKFKRWVVFTFLVHVVVIVVDKGAGLILARLLSGEPEVKGAVDMLSTLPFILMAIANLGLATSLVFHLRKRLYPVDAVAETTWAVAWLWGGMVALFAYFATRSIGPLLKPEWNFDPVYVAPICACIPLLLASSYFNSIQLAVDRIRDYNLVHVVGSVAFLPIFFGIYAATGGDAVQGMAFGRLATAALVLLVVLWMVRDFVRIRARVHWPFLRDGLTYGWRANVTSVLIYLNHRIDLYYVGGLFLAAGATGEALKRQQFAEAAFYSLAVSFAELVWHFPEAMRDLFFSKVASQSAEEARRSTPALSRMCLLVSCVGGLVVWLVFDPAMSLWMSNDWEAANWRSTVVPCVTILMPGTVFFTVAKILQNDLAARGRLDHCIAACVTTFVVMTVLGILWIPESGAIGAAWASTIAYGASVLYTLVAYRMTGGAPMLACLVPRRSDLVHLRDIYRAVAEKIGQILGRRGS